MESRAEDVAIYISTTKSDYRLGKAFVESIEQFADGPLIYILPDDDYPSDRMFGHPVWKHGVAVDWIPDFFWWGGLPESEWTCKQTPSPYTGLFVHWGGCPAPARSRSPGRRCLWQPDGGRSTTPTAESTATGLAAPRTAPTSSHWCSTKSPAT